MKKDIARKAFTSTIPVMSGYVVLGTAFGILARTGGLSFLQGISMSLFIYAGSLQFVLLPLLASKASFLTIGLTSLVVNARHLFYGITMASRYKSAGRAKPALIFGLTDETYSLVCSEAEGSDEKAEKDRISYSLLVTIFDHCWWLTGSAIGLAAGSAINFNTEGLDFALTALFITVATGQWLDNKGKRPAIAGFGCSILSLLIFGQDGFLIPAMIMIAFSILLMFAKESKSGKEAGRE